jgi:hypothetical protein
MKKLFAIALIATAMVACNNSGDKKEGTDTTTTVVPNADTVTTVTNTDTTVTAPGDTTMNKTVTTDTTSK